MAMQTTAILPRYFQAMTNVATAISPSGFLIPADPRRIYLRIVTGIAGIGFNPGIYIGGTADNQFWQALAASTVYEWWWDVHNVLVQSEFYVKDITDPGIKAIHSVVCIEEQLRRGYGIGKARKATAFQSRSIRSSDNGGPWGYSGKSTIKPRPAFSNLHHR